MSEARVSHVIMEVSSHALDQDRVEGVGFDVGVFTNLTSEHLDFHGTIQRYALSKAKLFSRFLEESKGKGEKCAVLNQDDPQADYFRSLTTARIIRYGMGKDVDITVEEARVSPQGISGLMKTPQGNLNFTTSLLGRFNLYNVMAAAGAAMALDINLDSISSALQGGIYVPGRMEKVGEGINYTVLVDYAHTPDALEHVLSSIKEFKVNRIITVFGCGGDRDRTKRPMMGGVAARLSDIVIITSDNPRTERPEAIIAQVEQGVKEGGFPAMPPSSFGECGKERKGYCIVSDRKEAIGLALRIAQTNDVVLVAGKGHEDYQIIGKQSIAFEDRKEIAEAIRNLTTHEEREV
jgi:UDP-N-acetylmuramoyl-L-alanyl-D-glutamate--2,6-diaminopimelate ligase